jgi:hypothetical protein
MKKYLILLISCVLISSLSYSQLEKLIVEKYYVTDSDDVTDTTGGKIELGAVTYRIYVDMKKGSKLKGVYGDVNHKIRFSSTSNFFNYKLDGQTFAKDFIKGRYGEGIVALDSWLTLGQTTKKQGTKTYFGTPKTLDNDGSFIGGSNNDGGSKLIASGLLKNKSTEIGLPLTDADGMDTMTQLPTSWNDYGIKNAVTGADSTIFGSLVPGKLFSSNQFSLTNSGVEGVDREANQVLVAQLTTKGELAFNLNLLIEENVDGVAKIVKYVSSDSVLLKDEIYSPLLKYPFECGCLDPNYLEYKSIYACNKESDCKTLIIYGCTDTMACNFDPKANFMIHNLCCYPGACNDRDIAEVCPQLKGETFEFELSPNPSNSDIYVHGIVGDLNEVEFKLYDYYGVEVFAKTISVKDQKFSNQFDISNLVNGLYIARITSNANTSSLLFLKN